MRSRTLIPVALLTLLASEAPAGTAPVRREVGNLVLEDVPEIPKAVAERTAQYQNVRGANLLDWDPKGDGLLATTRFGDTYQVHHVASPAAYRQQLTFFPEPVASAVYDPERGETGFLFSMDRGGGEFYQLYWLDRASGRHVLVTDGASRNTSLVMSRAGGKYAYASTRRNKTDFDVYVGAGDDPAAARLVLEVKGQWHPLDWSPADDRLLLMHYVSANESYLHVLELASGKLTPVGAREPGAPKVAYGTAAFASRDVVFATSDQDAELQRLVRFDLARGTREVLTPKLAWDVEEVEISRDGAQLAYTVNEGGRTALYVGSTARPTKASRVELPPGLVSGLRFDRSGRRLGLSMSTAQSTSDVYSVDPRSRRLTRWTFSEVGGLDAAAFVAPELVSFASFDGREIPSWYYKPRGKGPFPVVISIHGGPEGQAMAGFDPTAQLWVNELGAAVLAPNVRGSSGYGKSYLLLDNGMKREDSVKDIGALLDWIRTRPELDASRVAVIGGSYGGYMVLASMVHFGDRLRCAVDVVGISNFVSFLENTESYRRDLRRAEYGDERDPAMREFLLGIAPLRQASRLRKPLFVVQGKNDPRVPASEAEQIVEAVRANGSPVWYLLAKDEGHGLRKKQNRDVYLNATLLFLEQHLVGAAPAGSR